MKRLPKDSAATGPPGRPAGGSDLVLSERQAMVLRAVVAAYVAEAAPVGSRIVSHLLPVSLSSASIRATMAELMESGLLEQPHASSGRVPSELGLSLFVERLVELREPGAYQQRDFARALEDAESEGVAFHASQMLSEQTRQLGFVIPPRIDALVLQHVSLVRVASDRVLAVLVSTAGQTHRRVVVDESGATQRELDRMAHVLNDWAAGSTLPEARRRLQRELDRLRSRAGDALVRAVRLGLRAFDADAYPGAEASAAAPRSAPDLVIATRLALLDQPEFSDPRRVRALFEAIETRETLVDLLGRVLSSGSMSVVLGDQLDADGLEHCALVAAPVGGGAVPGGVIGVIGPSRMDYGQVMGWVDLCSRLLGQRLGVVASGTGAAPGSGSPTSPSSRVGGVSEVANRRVRSGLGKELR